MFERSTLRQGGGEERHRKIEKVRERERVVGRRAIEGTEAGNREPKRKEMNGLGSRGERQINGKRWGKKSKREVVPNKINALV